MQLRSPNELLEGAKKEMLNGRDPVDRDDWYLIVNFMAYNIAKEVNAPALLFIKKVYDIPLTDCEIRRISAFQVQKQEERRS